MTMSMPGMPARSWLVERASGTSPAHTDYVCGKPVLQATIGKFDIRPVGQRKSRLSAPGFRGPVQPGRPSRASSTLNPWENPSGRHAVAAAALGQIHRTIALRDQGRHVDAIAEVGARHAEAGAEGNAPVDPWQRRGLDR